MKIINNDNMYTFFVLYIHHRLQLFYFAKHAGELLIVGGDVILLDLCPKKIDQTILWLFFL